MDNRPPADFFVQMAYDFEMIVAIVGPTASGKTSLSIRVAKLVNGEIISADSRQVYRGMDIGTGKVTKHEMMGIPHHLIDVASPTKTFSAAQYQKLGKKAIKKILTKGKTPIIVGGTGFYLDSLLYNYELPDVKANPALRRKLEKKSAAELFVRLKKLDPRRAKDIDRKNKRRLIRALEIVLTTKKPVPSREAALAQRTDHDILKIGIALPEKLLKKNIAERLRKRLKQGMVREVERLHDDGLSWQRLDNFGLEYRYISRYLRGMLAKEQMISALEKEIWHYAKRQMTWFKRDKTIHWVKEKRMAIKAIRRELFR